MAETISASVGKHNDGVTQCYNIPKDQHTVIRLLNQISKADGGCKESPLADNPRWGICAPGLHQAILTFQRRHKGLSVDGHVDPGGAALRTLNALAPSVSPATTTSTSSARVCTLPASSPYAKWPVDLLETLCRSYQANGTTVDGQTVYPLPEAFQFDMHIEPSDFQDALDRSHAEFVKVVYDRVVLHASLWSFVHFIFNSWHTDNHGFHFSFKDDASKQRFMRMLEDSPHFCRDHPIMQVYHQAEKRKLPAVIRPSHQCWREVVNGTPGLHICINGVDFYDCEMHVDPHQIVEKKKPDGTCAYDEMALVAHGWDIRRLLGL